MDSSISHYIKNKTLITFAKHRPCWRSASTAKRAPSQALGLTVCISGIIHILTLPLPSCITYFVSICIADHPCDKAHSGYNDAKPEHAHSRESRDSPRQVDDESRGLLIPRQLRDKRHGIQGLLKHTVNRPTIVPEEDAIFPGPLRHREAFRFLHIVKKEGGATVGLLYES